MGKAPTTRSQIRVLELARGGMGTVEVVLRSEGGFRRLQAVKRLLPELRNDDSFRAMFLDEARVAGLVRHPNVVSVLDVGEDSEGPFLVMDYIEGLSLSETIKSTAKRNKPLPLQVCLQIASAVARGLHAAHELRGHDGRELHLVHRDVSPQNVLLSYEGEVRVADFGIAKALGRTSKTSTGLLKGKAGYMSPEQLSFREPDRRSDLFSLGVVLYEMLASRRLYPGGLESARRILDEAPPDLAEARGDVPDALVELGFDLLAKSPDDRPPTAESVANRVDEILNELMLSEEPLSIRDFLSESFGARRERERAVMRDAIEAAERLPARRSRRGWVVGAFSIVVVAAIASAAFWSREDQAQEQAQAQERAQAQEQARSQAQAQAQAQEQEHEHAQARAQEAQVRIQPTAEPVMFATPTADVAIQTPMRTPVRMRREPEPVSNPTMDAPMKGMPRWDWE